MDQGELCLRRSCLVETKNCTLLPAYRKFISEVITALGGSIDEEKDTEIDDLIKFEISLAKFTSPEEDRLNQTTLYTKMTLEELQDQTDPDQSTFIWQDYLEILTGLNLDDNESIVISELNYFNNTIGLIKNTPEHWETGGKVAEADLEYRKSSEGIKKEESRSELCIDNTKSVWGFAIAVPYIRKYFPETSQQEALQMIKDIHEAFSQRLNAVEFMDKNTKRTAEEKSKAMINKIGYPEWLFNVTAQREYYSLYPEMDGAYFTNELDCANASNSYDFQELRKPVDREEFPVSPITVNAEYDQSSNSITIPAGILQPPFFKGGLPRACNYGAIGFVMGHELTHGFDNTGSQYDKYGNINRWWPEDVEESFRQKTRCYADQYDDYCPEQLRNKTDECVSGKVTNGENIADNGGLEISYKAYKNYVDQHGADMMLPGMEDITPEQLFFISMANIWCGVYTDESLEATLDTDVHSPLQYRVIGTVSNSPEFAKVFGCPVGPMNNGNQKCALW